MADEGGDEPEELSDKQKAEIARWFLTNAPAGEIQYVAKGAAPLIPFLFAVSAFRFRWARA